MLKPEYFSRESEWSTEELLLLPQVVYNQTASRFFNRLESWWNRRSRLQHSADDIVNESIPEADGAKEGATLDCEDLQEWLEDRAKRTSILHQMVRKTEKHQSLKAENGLCQSTYKAVLCAKLANEYLATVVKLLASLLANWDGSPGSTTASPDEHHPERNIREIMSVSTKQIFHQLQAVQSELTSLHGPAQDSDAARDLRQTRQLVDAVETTLFTLFNGFSKFGLVELDVDGTSDSSVSDSCAEQDDDLWKSNSSRGKIRGVCHISPSTTGQEVCAFGQNTDFDNPPLDKLLFDMVNNVIKELARTTTNGAQNGLDRSWIMLDVTEELRQGLANLYHRTSAPTTLNDFDHNYGIPTIFSKERTTNIDCRASIAWTTFNASLIKVSVSLSIYGNQQRMNSPGKANRRQRTAKSRDTLLRLVLDPRERIRREQLPTRSLSMPDVEKAWIELLKIASVCTDLSNTRARVTDMLRLITSLWERYVEYQTAIWMTLPNPRPKVTDYIDLTGVAKSFRFLIGEAMWRHGLSANDLMSFGLEQDLAERWAR